jgi:hypothetical protein
MGTKTADTELARLFDKPADAGQFGVGADPGGAHGETAAGVDGGAHHGVARPHFHGNRLAGEQARVDRAGAVHDHAVGGHLLARAHHEQVADRQLGDRDALLENSARRPAQHRHILGAQVHQCREGRPGAGLRSRLEVAPGEEEHRHGGGDLEVDLAGTIPGHAEAELHAHAGHAGIAEE